MLHIGSATLAVVAALSVANAEDTRASSGESSGERKVVRSPDDHLKNETVPGVKNASLAAENPDSA